MKSFIALTLGLLTSLSTLAASLEQRMAVENDYRNRVKNVIERVDPAAIVLVRVDLKKVVAEDLPGMGFGAEITPMDRSGQLNKSSIEKVSVRIATQIESVPEWIKNEIGLAIGNDVKTDISIEKAKGVITDSQTEMTKFAMAATQSAVEGISSLKWGLWSLAAGLILMLTAIGFILNRFAQRLETSLSKVIEEKVVPAMQNSSRGIIAPVSEAAKESKPMNLSIAGAMGGSGQKELADIPVDALISLFSDCYWTHSDGYAHYLWSQMTQEQRKKALESESVDPKYFSYFLQFPTENLNYHFDARYLLLSRDFENLNQNDLADWVMSNPSLYRRITPMRWDLLPLDLEKRLKFMDISEDSSEKPKAIKIAKASAPRKLKEKLQIKKLTPADENFAWSHPSKVPAEARRELPSLVWLGLCPPDKIESILSDLDARQLASAWVGPEEVLAKLKASLAPKKQEMLEHFLKDGAANRQSDTFKYLAEAGIVTLSQVEASVEPQKDAA